MPEKILVKTPPGYDLKECIEHFKRDYAAKPLSTYLVVPTERLSENIRDTLIKDGISIAEKAVTTPKAFACEICEKKGGCRLISDEEAKMLLFSAIKKNKKHIASISASKEYSSRLLNDIYTLTSVLSERRADFKEIFPAERSEKNRALAAIIGTYNDLTAEKHLIPPAGVFGAAADFIKKDGALSPGAGIIFSGIYEPHPSLKTFMKAAADCAEKCVYFMPFCSDPKICRDKGEWFCPKTVKEIQTGDFALACEGIFGGQTAENLQAEVYAKRYKSIRGEISGIAAEIRALIDSGACPSGIAVAFTDPAGTAPLIDEIFSDYGLLYSSSATLPFSLSPVVQSVLLITETVLKNFSGEAVTEFFSSPYIKTGVRASAADSIAAKARITDGFSSWENKIKRYIEREKGRLSSPETPDYRKNGINREIEKAKSALEEIIPVLCDLNALKGDDTCRGHTEKLLRLLERWDVLSVQDNCPQEMQERDFADIERLLMLLKGLCDTSEAAGDESVSFSEYSRILSSAAGNLRVSGRRNDSRVQVTGIRGLECTSFDYVFLGGLVDGKIPDIPSLLPYTTESQDQAIWPDKRREKVRAERFYFIAAMCPAKSALYLSCHSEACGRQEIPSQFYETAAENLCAKTPDERDKGASFSYSVAKTGEYISRGEIYPGFCLPEGISAQSVCDRINIENYYRKGLYDSPYDGLLEDGEDIAEALAERFPDSHAYSPTSLETYAGCPFRFYLRHVLGLNPPPELSYTLSPSDRGDLIHRILFSFYTEWKKTHDGAPLPVEREEALSHLKSCAESEIEAFGMQGPAWDSMAKEILGTTGYGTGILEKFADEETGLSEKGLIPEYFEAGFGFPGAGTSFSDEPVRIESESGKAIYIRGFVDRIDVKDGRDFVIIDYKTGKHPAFKDIADGKALQIPLYLRAASAGSGMRGIGGFYYTISKKKVSRKAELYEKSEEEFFSAFNKARIKDRDLEEVVSASVDSACGYAEGIRLGRFTPAEDTAGCSAYCDFKSVCRFSEFRLLEQENTTEAEEGDKSC